MSPSKTCPKCGTTAAVDTKFCGSCGASLQQVEATSSPTCSECGAELRAGAKFCPSCGAEQQAETAKVGSGRRFDWKTAMIPIIALPFLVGIFYLLSAPKRTEEHSHPVPPGATNEQSSMQMQQVFHMMDSLRTSLQSNPSDTTAMLVLGELYEAAGKYGQAREFYSKFVALHPDRILTRARVARTYLAEQNAAAAEAEIAEMKRRRPDDPHLSLTIGELYEIARQFDKARGYYEAYLQHDPSSIDARMRIANTHFEEKNYQAAIVQLDAILAKQPNNAQALYNYAYTQHLLGNNDVAIEYWKRAASSDPNGEIGKHARDAIAAFQKG